MKLEIPYFKQIDTRTKTKLHWFECIFPEDYEPDGCAPAIKGKTKRSGVKSPVKRKPPKK